MPLVALIPLALLPSLVWLWLICRRDAHEREPLWLVAAAFGLGAGATLGVLWLRPTVETALEHLVGGQLRAAVDAFVVTAMTEEALKLLALAPLCLHRELDEPLDGVVYGAAVALGFAAVENALFAHRAESVGLVLQRAFTATLLHVCCTAGLGFALANAKLPRRRGRPGWVVAGLMFAVGLHGSYDWFLAGSRGLALVSLLLLLPLGLVVLAGGIRWARARSAWFHPVSPPARHRRSDNVNESPPAGESS